MRCPRRRQKAIAHRKINFTQEVMREPGRPRQVLRPGLLAALVALFAAISANLTAAVPDIASSGNPRPMLTTGANARTEFRFADQTLVRLGANTSLYTQEGTRHLELRTGAVLLRAPRSASGAQIRTGNLTAELPGTTLIVEYYRDAYIKFLVLEGTVRIFVKGQLGESLLARPGQLMMLKPSATRLASLVDFDLERLMQTSQLIKNFPPLPDGGPIQAAIAQQKEAKKNGTLIDTNLVIFGRGTLVTLTTPDSNPPKAQSSATPRPTVGSRD